MNEQEINADVLGLVTAIANNDDVRAGHHLTVLVGSVILDLKRVADAVEKLAKSNPDPTAPVSLRDLSPEERETIEALRKGDIKVVAVPGKG